MFEIHLTLMHLYDKLFLKMGKWKERANMECQNCGRDFIPSRDWQKFCRKQCQQRWNQAQYRAARVAGELMANGNGASVEDAHREKWERIRAEWAEEDRQDAEQQPRFLRRF